MWRAVRRIRTGAARCVWCVRRVRGGGQRAEGVGQVEMGRSALEQGQRQTTVSQLQTLGSLLLLWRSLGCEAQHAERRSADSQTVDCIQGL